MCSPDCVVIVSLLTLPFLAGMLLVFEFVVNDHCPPTPSSGNNEGGLANNNNASSQLMMSYVCSRTSNPTFCLKALRSDDHQINIAADPHLTQFALNLTASDGNNTRQKISALLLDPKNDARTNYSLNNCAFHYDFAIYYLKEAALDDFPKYQFARVKAKAAAAAAALAPFSCQDGFKPNPSPCLKKIVISKNYVRT